jgi:hypothetical protein
MNSKVVLLAAAVALSACVEDRQPAPTAQVPSGPIDTFLVVVMGTKWNVQPISAGRCQSEAQRYSLLSSPSLSVAARCMPASPTSCQLLRQQMISMDRASQRALITMCQSV